MFPSGAIGGCRAGLCGLQTTLASADGRRVMTMNRNGDWGEQRLEDAAVETEFCER